MKNREFVYGYWSRRKLSRLVAALDNNNLPYSDLLFLIPNNVKKMHGLPLTRMSGRKKKKQKNQRKNNIFSFGFFNNLEDTISKILCSEWTDGEFFDEFVGFKKHEY